MKGAAIDLRELTRALRADPEAAKELASVLMTALAAAAEPTEWSSRRGCGPSRYPERRWKAIARQIGTRPPGCRWRVVTAAQLEAFERGATSTAPTTTPAPETWNPAAAIERAGLRVVRGAR